MLEATDQLPLTPTRKETDSIMKARGESKKNSVDKNYGSYGQNIHDEEGKKNYSSINNHTEEDKMKYDSRYNHAEDGKENYSSSYDHETSEPITVRTYKTRFWILVLYCVLAFVHNLLWITWGPISESMEAAFSGWDKAKVALLTDWGTSMYVVWMLPACWATQRWGLRVGTLASAALLAVGTALRCITMTEPYFTVLCHVCAILVGISGAFILTTPPLFAATWFPPKERTTALAVMMGSYQLGALGSYLEPLLVKVPSDSITVHQVRQQVATLLNIGVGVCGILLVVVVVYFPAKPPSPPSLSSITTRVLFATGLKSIFTNTRLLVLLLCYGVFAGPPIAWVTVLNYSLIPLGFHQDTTMWVGMASVLASSTAPVISGRINDLYQGHIKLLLVVLMTATTACFYWFLLLTYGVIPASTWQVYMTVVGGTALSYTTLPLFCEAAIDLAYPAPEILVSGVMIAADNAVITIFLLILNIPNIGSNWISYTQVFTSCLTILPLFLFNLRTTRADIDK